MTVTVTRGDIVHAMMRRIQNGEPFQAKLLTEVGEKLHGFNTSIFEDGVYTPISRIADKILQFERKAMRIKFHAGWWRLVP